jgi:hypothetical protein
MHLANHLGSNIFFLHHCPYNLFIRSGLVHKRVVSHLRNGVGMAGRDYDGSVRQNTVEKCYQLNHINQTYDYVSTLLHFH